MQPPRSSICHSFIVFSLLLCCSAVHAQKSVHFQDLTFEEATQKAKKEKKIVFVDVRGMNTNSFTDKVDKEIFTLDSIADFFNAHCISIRMNMGSEEGKKFAPRLAMLMYPCYVFHSHVGDQLDFTNAGSITKDPGVLMAKARSSIDIDKIKNANTRSITFTKDSWTNVLQQAKAAHKLIFLDAQTTWCRPCIMMAKDVFTLDRVADYYNQHFINVTLDMEKGDGPQLAKQYAVHAYPSFLYIDGDGKLIHQDGGYQEADKFLQVGQTAVSKSSAGQPAAAVADSGMHFTPGTWASLLARAREEGKLIFLDANTSWCGPCKQMRREIFPQKAVAQLYNSNFINVDMDMEKGEGIDIRKKYAVHAYPTFLYINGDGEIVHKTVGSCEAVDFRQHGLDALSPSHNLLYLSKKYSEHQKEEGFVSAYLTALRDAAEDGLADTVAVTFLQTRGPSTWKDAASWKMLNDFVNNATAAPFLALVKEQATYGTLFGQEDVEKKIYQTYLAWPHHYLQYPENGKAILDQPAFDAFMQQVKASKYGKKAEVEARSKLTIYFGLREWSNYATTVNGMLSDHIIPMNAIGAEWIYSFADVINRFATSDQQALANATKWAKLISYDINPVKPADKASYLDIYATLLEKTGQTDQALQVRKDINQQQLSAAKDATPFKTLTRIIPKQN
jgi:thioredoxin-related protein